MIYKLKELFELQMGKTPSRHNADYWGGNNKWISIADIGNANKYIENTKECISDKAVAESGIKKVPKGTVIMSFKLTIGKTTITTEDMFTNEAIMAFIDKGICPIDTDYLYHFCCGKDWLAGTNKAVMGLTLNKATLSDIKISVPDIEIQREIADRLDKVVGLIEKRKEQLVKLDQLVKSRFIEMFASSKEMKVEEVCSSFKIGPFGSALHKNEISNSGYAFVLGTDNAVKNEFAFKEIRYINEEKFKQLEKYTVDKDDIIMSMMGTVGRVALIPETLGRAIISSHLCILKVNKSLMYPEFFHVAFSQDDDIQQQIEGIHNGSIMKGFNLKIVKSFKIKCPSLPEQLHFINLKKQIDKSKFDIQQSINKLETLKKSLMQQYFG